MHSRQTTDGPLVVPSPHAFPSDRTRNKTRNFQLSITFRKMIRMRLHRVIIMDEFRRDKNKQ